MGPIMQNGEALKGTIHLRPSIDANCCSRLSPHAIATNRAAHVYSLSF